MKFTQSDPVFEGIRTVGRMPADVSRVDAGCLAVQDGMKSTHGAAIAKVLQDIDGELLIPAPAARNHQTVEPQFFANI